MPKSCKKPLFTNRALSLSKAPFDKNLTRKTHLQVIGTMPEGRLISSYVSLAMSASISFCIANFYSGTVRACLYDLGLEITNDEARVKVKALAELYQFWHRMSILNNQRTRKRMMIENYRLLFG